MDCVSIALTRHLHKNGNYITVSLSSAFEDCAVHEIPGRATGEEYYIMRACFICVRVGTDLCVHLCNNL